MINNFFFCLAKNTNAITLPVLFSKVIPSNDSLLDDQPKECSDLQRRLSFPDDLSKRALNAPIVQSMVGVSD